MSVKIDANIPDYVLTSVECFQKELSELSDKPVSFDAVVSFLLFNNQQLTYWSSREKLKGFEKFCEDYL